MAPLAVSLLIVPCRLPSDRCYRYASIVQVEVKRVVPPKAAAVANGGANGSTGLVKSASGLVKSASGLVNSAASNGGKVGFL